MNQWSLWVLTLHTSFLGHLVISSHERESHEDVHPKGPAHFHWNYEGPAHFHWNYEDESHWDAHYSFCGGREQSPINIETRTIKYNPSLKPILLSGYNMSSGEMLTLKNNGHTVVLDLPSNLEIIGGLPQAYRAVQLHFHWGSKSSPGSEHTVNGERFHGEIHVVHYSTEYENISEAQTHPGGLAVLAAFIQEGPDQNPTYDHILSYFEEVNEDGESIQIPGFNIRGLLPERMDRYYRYNGSLTTPPCFQSVNWTIFNQTIALSKNQLSILEDTIHIDQHHILQKNFRKPQKLNTRLVFSSFRQAVGGRRGTAPGSEDAHSGQEAHQEAAAMTTGDMLAIIFGILFMVTAVAFFVYMRRSKKQRSGSENKSNVIYKAATTEENLE